MDIDASSNPFSFLEEDLNVEIENKLVIALNTSSMETGRNEEGEEDSTSDEDYKPSPEINDSEPDSEDAEDPLPTPYDVHARFGDASMVETQPHVIARFEAAIEARMAEETEAAEAEPEDNASQSSMPPSSSPSNFISIFDVNQHSESSSSPPPAQAVVDTQRDASGPSNWGLSREERIKRDLTGIDVLEELPYKETPNYPFLVAPPVSGQVVKRKMRMLANAMESKISWGIDDDTSPSHPAVKVLEVLCETSMQHEYKHMFLSNMRNINSVLFQSMRIPPTVIKNLTDKQGIDGTHPQDRQYAKLVEKDHRDRAGFSGEVFPVSLPSGLLAVQVREYKETGMARLDWGCGKQGEEYDALCDDILHEHRFHHDLLIGATHDCLGTGLDVMPQVVRTSGKYTDYSHAANRAHHKSTDGRTCSHGADKSPLAYLASTHGYEGSESRASLAVMANPILLEFAKEILGSDRMIYAGRPSIIVVDKATDEFSNTVLTEEVDKEGKTLNRTTDEHFPRRGGDRSGFHADCDYIGEYDLPESRRDVVANNDQPASVNGRGDPSDVRYSHEDYHVPGEDCVDFFVCLSKGDDTEGTTEFLTWTKRYFKELCVYKKMLRQVLQAEKGKVIQYTFSNGLFAPYEWCGSDAEMGTARMESTNLDIGTDEDMRIPFGADSHIPGHRTIVQESDRIEAELDGSNYVVSIDEVNEYYNSKTGVASQELESHEDILLKWNANADKVLGGYGVGEEGDPKGGGGGLLQGSITELTQGEIVDFEYFLFWCGLYSLYWSTHGDHPTVEDIRSVGSIGKNRFRDELEMHDDKAKVWFRYYSSYVKRHPKEAVELGKTIERYLLAYVIKGEYPPLLETKVTRKEQGVIHCVHPHVFHRQSVVSSKDCTPFVAIHLRYIRGPKWLSQEYCGSHPIMRTQFYNYVRGLHSSFADNYLTDHGESSSTMSGESITWDQTRRRVLCCYSMGQLQNRSVNYPLKYMFAEKKYTGKDHISFRRVVMPILETRFAAAALLTGRRWSVTHALLDQSSYELMASLRNMGVDTKDYMPKEVELDTSSSSSSTSPTKKQTRKPQTDGSVYDKSTKRKKN